MNSVVGAFAAGVVAGDAERQRLQLRARTAAMWTYCSTGCGAVRQRGARTKNPYPWRRFGAADGGDAIQNRPWDGGGLAQVWA